jgi:lysophospholipase L1-like esterase
LSVYITDTDALDRLETIEGCSWRSYGGGEDNFQRILLEYREFREALGEGDLAPTNWRAPVLYGKDGYTRYAVGADGEMMLQAWSTRPERIALAEEQGFRVIGQRNPLGKDHHGAERSLNIEDADVFDCFAYVEGPAWLQTPGVIRRVTCYQCAYRAWRKWLDEETERQNTKEKIEERKGVRWKYKGSACLEFAGKELPFRFSTLGGNRYEIGDNGDLMLLVDSASDDTITRAKSVGFRVGRGVRGNPSRRVKRAARRVRRFVTSPTGAAVIAAGALGAIGIILYAARRGPLALGPRQNPGPGRTAVIGDSIVAHSNGFVRYLDQNVPGRSFTNFGVVGQGTQAILNDLRNQVIGRGFDEVIIEGGANDLGRSNASEYITSRLRTMVQEAKAAGLKVVLLPMIPMARAAGQIPPINAITMGQGRSWGADVIVDTYSLLNDGRGGIIAQYVSPDGIHPTRDGQLIIGRAIQSRAYA